jgi:AraC-like DNA-binding protein
MIFWELLFFTAVAQGVFQVDLLLWNKKTASLSNRLLLVFLLLPTLISLDYLLLTSGGFRYFPHLFGSSFCWILLLGPTLFFYTKSVLEKDFIFEKKHLLHLLPILLFVVFTLPIFSLNTNDKIHFISDYLNEKVDIELLTYFAYILHIVQIAVYLYFNEQQLRANTKEKPLQLDWLKFLRLLLFVYLILLCLAYIHSVFYQKYTLVEVYFYAISNSLLVFAISAKLFQHSTLILGENQKKYQHSTLNAADKKRYAQQIEQLMTEQKCYLEPELKLGDMAKMLDISSQHLSETINDNFQQSFNDFVNTYRVTAFQQRLQEPDSEQLTLLALAYEVGFNSKNTFNTAFKKMTGLTPMEYKKQKTSS